MYLLYFFFFGSQLSNYQKAGWMAIIAVDSALCLPPKCSPVYIFNSTVPHFVERFLQ